MTRRWLTLALVASAATAAAGAQAQDFSYLPPGDLIASSGSGRADNVIYAPTMLFPMQDLPAFANSQVYMNGGYLGPGGGQCDDVNYSYPWRDNYCEERSWDMPLCPAGTGHQGQDIRASTCVKDVHPVLAAEDGTITNVGSYSVYLTTADGTRFDYLHMSNVQVAVGNTVSRGDMLGMVSNQFGGTATSIHLHFNIRQNVQNVGVVYVPPYTSLISAYEKLVGGGPGNIDGALEQTSCEAIVGWAFDPADREVAITVPLVFDQNGVARDVLADVYRGDLCENLGFCDHGFDQPSPYSLFDGAPHDVAASNGVASLAGSPLTLECETPELAGARRAVSSGDYASWALSSFWDEPPVAADAVAAVKEGPAFPATPELWRVDEALFVVDDGADVLRPISDSALRAWRLSADAATPHGAAEKTVGSDWPERPMVVRDASGDTFVMDVASPSMAGGGAGGETVDDAVVPDATGEAGCGCQVPAGVPFRGVGWLGLMVGAAALRRRRSR